ncbi:hypothetical protein [Bdellovibrio sp. ArHS]|uniref:hypothetical protein n=1 Tax=Bdellovibrio sp. ArHS TaxID=1569284 RepID=UPI000A7CCFE6|nr:hypothetical protein [Bdellovibrio sp. ArHS]
METDGEKIAISANVGDERTQNGVIYVKWFSPPERMSQAIKKLGLFWLIAVVSVVIPVFHFVSIPLFFGLGVFFALRSYKSEGKVLSGLVLCPHCLTEVKIKPTEIQWPLSEICQNCARVVRMEKSVV